MTRQQQRQPTPDEVDRIRRIDDVKRSYFADPGGPDNRMFRPRGRVHPDVVRAQTRLRTARWRADRKRAGAPALADVGLAMVWSLVTSERQLFSDTTGPDFELVRRALTSLQARGFDVGQAKAVLRRYRNRLMDSADRDGEASDDCGPPLRPSSWGPDEALF